MTTTTTEQTVNIPENLEEFQLDIINRARELGTQPFQLPGFQVAGMTPVQQLAMQRGLEGIGAYQPMLQAGADTLGSGIGYLTNAGLMTQGALSGAMPFRDASLSTFGQGVDAARGIDIGALTGYGSQMADAGRAAAGEIGRTSRLGQPFVSGAQGDIRGAQGTMGQAGQFGLGSARSGIAGLAGTGGRFSADQIQPFMNQFEDAAVKQAMADIREQGEEQRAGLDARAVGAGAFGGSRGALQQAKLTDDILEQQGRTAAGMRQAGFESAAARAQKAFEDQQARQQRAAIGTGQLGQMGAGAQLAAGRGIGQLGLGLGQLGLRSAGQEMAGAQAAGGMNLAGLRGALGAAGTAGQLGLGQAGQFGRLGQGIGALGSQFGQLGLAGAGQMGKLGQSLGGMGMNQAKLGEAAQGLASNDINTLLRLGGGEQQQRQAEIDAQRKTQYQNVMAPFQQLGYYSDVFQGLPMGQTSIGTQQTPNPSLFSQIGGLGLGLYGLTGGQGLSGIGSFLGLSQGGRV